MLLGFGAALVPDGEKVTGRGICIEKLRVSLLMCLKMSDELVAR